MQVRCKSHLPPIQLSTKERTRSEGKAKEKRTRSKWKVNREKWKYNHRNSGFIRKLIKLKQVKDVNHERKQKIPLIYAICVRKKINVIINVLICVLINVSP